MKVRGCDGRYSICFRFDGLSRNWLVGGLAWPVSLWRCSAERLLRLVLPLYLEVCFLVRESKAPCGYLSHRHLATPISSQELGLQDLVFSNYRIGIWYNVQQPGQVTSKGAGRNQNNIAVGRVLPHKVLPLLLLRSIFDSSLHS
jgi:hypothetical protein